MSTIREVAESAGVSVTTVSHALSGKRPVAPGTRSRVAEAVRALDYQPSQLAIAMLTGRSMTLGAVVPDIKNPFFGELLGAVESAADARGYGTIVTSTELRPNREQRQIDMLAAKRVDAILLIGCSDEAVAYLPRGSEVPVVIVDQMPESSAGFPLVRSDHEGGGRLAAEHLLQLGHREVGVIAGPRTMSVAAARLKGFLAHMASCGTAVARAGRTSARQFTLPSGRAAARSLLLRSPQLTAVFCANDLIAYGALHAAAEIGRRVPDDLSVVGFDDIFVSTMVQPTLTTIRQDIAGLGRYAVEMALRELQGETGLPRQRCCDVSLIVRASSGPAPVVERAR